MEMLEDKVPILENGNEADIDPDKDMVKANKPSIEKGETKQDEKTQGKQEESTEEKKNDLINDKNDDIERKKEENEQTDDSRKKKTVTEQIDGIKDEPERKGEESKQTSESSEFKENVKEKADIKQETDNGENMETEAVKTQEPKFPVGRKRGPKKKSLETQVRSPRKPANGESSSLSSPLLPFLFLPPSLNYPHLLTSPLICPLLHLLLRFAILSVLQMKKIILY